MTYDDHSIYFKLIGASFVDLDSTLTLRNPAASAGQTLLPKVADSAQAGAQLAINRIFYEVEIPIQAPVIATGQLRLPLGSVF